MALSEYLTSDPARLMFLKSAQTPVVYNLDLLAGPTRRELEMAQKLERKSRWCFTNNCYNNIYYRSANVTEKEQNIANLISRQVPNAWINEH